VAWERLNVLGHIVWNKVAEPGFDGWKRKMRKESLRGFYMSSERVIFCEPRTPTGAPAFSELVRTARTSAGLTQAEVCGKLGLHGAVNRGGTVANWELGLNAPDHTQWQALQTLLALPPFADAVRHFAVTSAEQFEDIWTFESVAPYPGKHPCEKPIPLLAHMLNASTKPGALVLDAFMGSGATGDACARLGRRFIGIERDREHFESACRRLEQQHSQAGLFA
jgi:adenine-specific DNA-methyltransferase